MDSWLDGSVVEKFGFWLGGIKYNCDVVEADIGDVFFTGVDFLKHVKCKKIWAAVSWSQTKGIEYQWL